MPEMNGHVIDDLLDVAAACPCGHDFQLCCIEAAIRAAHEVGRSAGRQEAARYLRSLIDSNPVPRTPDNVRALAEEIADGFRLTSKGEGE